MPINIAIYSGWIPEFPIVGHTLNPHDSSYISYIIIMNYFCYGGIPLDTNLDSISQDDFQIPSPIFSQISQNASFIHAMPKKPCQHPNSPRDNDHVISSSSFWMLISASTPMVIAFTSGRRDVHDGPGPSCQGLKKHTCDRCVYKTHGGFHKWGYPNSWMVYKFTMENPIHMDDLGVPPFQETSIILQ